MSVPFSVPSASDGVLSTADIPIACMLPGLALIAKVSVAMVSQSLCALTAPKVRFAPSSVCVYALVESVSVRFSYANAIVMLVSASAFCMHTVTFVVCWFVVMSWTRSRFPSIVVCPLCDVVLIGLPFCAYASASKENSNAPVWFVV